MSDLDRNHATPFGRTAGRVDTAAVDAGLRSYMLKIYNYMSIGLAITGLAALGVYMFAVTGDASLAAKSATGASRPEGRQVSDAVRLRIVREPVEVGVHACAAGDGVRHLALASTG